jgi:CRISPR-associated protein Cmr2
MASSLLKFQIGPVQDFIAQARSTRDLWSGSYLLSWLVAAGIRRLKQGGGTLVFPCDADACQPLLELPSAIEHADHKAILTPNLPNIFIARVEGDPVDLAKKVATAIDGEWRNIANAVWEELERFNLPAAMKPRFDAQVKRHLSISWMVTPLEGEGDEVYRAAYCRNGWHLDAVRQVRDFSAWASCSPEDSAAAFEKDSLSGKEEGIYRGTGEPNEYKLAGQRLLNRHKDWLGAISLIKRLWHIAYLEGKMKLATSQLRIRSIPAIAGREATHDDEETAAEKSAAEKYIAAIAFDGDSIGKWVNGDFLPADSRLEEHHRNFSKALSHFALQRVRAIVEREVRGCDSSGTPITVPLGQLIYAGGDDVVCLVPADVALEVAANIRDAFKESTCGTPSRGNLPDASAGIAIAHIHAPLQDLIREAQKAEKRAKNEGPRPAFSVTIMKRSGEISHWTAQWPAAPETPSPGGLPLYQTISDLMQSGALSGRFPHRVCQLLSPYLTNTSGIARQTDAVTDQETVNELIRREFAHVAERQGSPAVARQLVEPLTNYLAGLSRVPEGAIQRSIMQRSIMAVIDLCTTLAFARRTAPSNAGNPSMP